MVFNILNLIDELQQLLDYDVIGGQKTRIESLIKDAIEVLKVIPTGGIAHFDTFKKMWLNCGYTKYDDDVLANYVRAVEILNNSTIRVVEETTDKVDLFDMEDKTTYVVGNLTDTNITQEEAELLKKIGINSFCVVNKE